jgi:IS30 family transposase
MFRNCAKVLNRNLIEVGITDSNFEDINDDEVEAVMNKLNHRPRKTLKIKTPHTDFFADTLQ